VAITGGDSRKRKREDDIHEQDMKDREDARAAAEANRVAAQLAAEAAQSAAEAAQSDMELLRSLVTQGDADAKRVFLARMQPIASP